MTASGTSAHQITIRFHPEQKQVNYLWLFNRDLRFWIAISISIADMNQQVHLANKAPIMPIQTGLADIKTGTKERGSILILKCDKQATEFH